MKSLIILLFGLCLAVADNAAVQEFTKANNLFARSVYKEISATSNNNFMVSPFSAETVIAWAQSGSKGETAQEIRTALHLPDNKGKVEAALKILLPKFKDNGLYTLRTANKMYVKENFALSDEFKTTATEVYNAAIENINFSKNVEAAKIMNNWVEEQTNNKIKNLISSDELDRYTRTVLINALYFQANWSNPFSLKAITKKSFYRTATDAVEVDTLTHWQQHFNYYESPELKAQFLELPFQGGEASMVIVLPNEKNGLASLENQLDQVFEVLPQLKSEYLNVMVPKFRIESLIDFKDILQKIGVRKVFDEKEADLSGVGADKGDLVITEIKQKTYFDMSESGVEAAAATYAVFAVPVSANYQAPIPKNFIADHPFLFYIKVKDLIVFEGRLTDPLQH